MGWWIVVVVGAALVGLPVAHAAWVVHYALTQARLDQRMSEYVQR